MNGEAIHYFAYPVWEVIVSILCIAGTIPATYGAVWFVKRKIRAFCRTRAMWRQLNKISGTGYMQVRPRV